MRNKIKIKGRVKTILSRYLLMTGVIGQLSLVAVFVYLMNTEYLSARQLTKKVLEKLDLNPPAIIAEILQPSVKNKNISLDGRIIKTHPRILLPQLAKWKGIGVSEFIKNRLSEHEKDKAYLNYCGSEHLLPSVVCWLTTNNEKLLTKIIRKMLGYELNVPTADTTYSNGWALALAYDLVFPALSEPQRKTIEQKIKKALVASLANLDEDSASLWHGRSTHAAIAWICAVAISNRIDGVDQLRRRAQGYFLTAIDGLAYTGVWPGGYNYWIQARAFLFALASSAYLNGLTHDVNARKIKQVMREVGYWTVYATRPDNKIEGFGDEGSRVDLKDETRRVIDLIVQMTHDPVLAGYSRFLAKLHGVESYYRGYRWGFLLFNDPSIWAVGDGTMQSIGEYLPVARLFGKKATNYAYFRSGWGKDDTFVSFKAGHSFSHHGHYDAGHFTIFKGSPLAINSSTYHGFFNPHRLNYEIRTIAKNSLLIQKPGEQVKPNRHFKLNVADGGQRLTMPTGSAILSVSNWFENYQQGRHFEGAELLDYSSQGHDYAYISADLTHAYNNTQYDDNHEGGKVSQVIRQLLFLPQEDHVIVYDKVTTTKALFRKKWLLHMVNKPKIAGLTVLKGDQNNGIMESHSDRARIRNGRGFLRMKILYPEHPVMHLVGGKDYQYYVETDADDRTFNGTNFNQGSSTSNWFDVGWWRIEVQPQIPRLHDQFLVVMSPSLNYQRFDKVERLDIQQKNMRAMETTKSVIIFVPALGSYQVNVKINDPKKNLFIVGLSVFKTVTLLRNNKIIAQINSKNGVAFYHNEDYLRGNLTLKW